MTKKYLNGTSRDHMISKNKVIFMDSRQNKELWEKVSYRDGLTGPKNPNLVSTALPLARMITR